MAKNPVGAFAGIVFGLAGLTLGLWYSWQGFASQPHGPFDFGVFLGSVGLVLGLCFAATGSLHQLYQKSLRGQKPPL